MAGKTAAFFDFDRTLLIENSPKLGIRYLWDMGQVSLGYVLKVVIANWFYQRNLVTETAMANLLLSFYKNKNLAPFEAGATEYYHQIIKPHLAPNIVSRAQEHKEQGHALVLISAGIRYLLRPVAEDLRFDHLVCTDLKVGRSGLLTGKPHGEVCAGKTKKKAAAELAQRLGIDLARSYAYGDHHSDIPLLEIVGNPRAVEPTKRLRQVAANRGWPILTHR